MLKHFLELAIREAEDVGVAAAAINEAIAKGQADGSQSILEVDENKKRFLSQLEYDANHTLSHALNFPEFEPDRTGPQRVIIIGLKHEAESEATGE